MKCHDGQFQLSKPEVRAVLAFASKDPCREMMCAVHFDPQAGAIAATDGHALIKANGMQQCPTDAPFLVARKDLEAAARMLSRKDHVLCVSRGMERDVRLCPADGAKLDADGQPTMFGTLDVQAVDATFPPTDRAIPQAGTAAEKTEVHHIDPKFYARIGLLEKAGVKRINCYGQTGQELDPVLYTAHVKDDDNEASYTIVVMPMRV